MTSTVPAPGETVAVIRTSDDMVEAMRTIKARLSLSNAFCDAIGGLTTGHTDKVLGPTRSKNLSPMLFDMFCELFAVEFHMVLNMDAVKRMEARWEGRETRNVRLDANRVSKALLDRAKPHIMRASGALGAAARNAVLTAEQRSSIARKAARKSGRLNGLTPEQRSTIARKASNARWSKQRSAIMVPIEP